MSKTQKHPDVLETRKDMPSENTRPLYLDAQATTPLVIKTEMLFILSIQLPWLPVNIFHSIE
jgi:hypothetical protein